MVPEARPMQESLNSINIGSAVISVLQIGDAGSFSAVAVSVPDGRRWIVSPNFRRLSEDELEAYTGMIRREALELAADNASREHLPVAFAYVRSLPMGCRSPFVDSIDDQLQLEAREDIRQALAAALACGDSYRAAVEFEARTPFLVADRGLIEVMDGIFGAFNRSYNESEWIAVLAAKKEAELKANSSFAAAHLSSFKNKMTHHN